MLNCNNSAAATAAKLFQGCLVYSILWLLRGHLLLGWVWHYLLWPLLLGLFWRPHIVTSVPTFVLVSCYCAKTCAKTQTHIDHLVNFMNEFMKTQVLVLVMGGGWQTVAALLIAASLTLPRLPVPRRLWPFSLLRLFVCAEQLSSNAGVDSPWLASGLGSLCSGRRSAHGATSVYTELVCAQVKERRSNLPLTQQKRHDPYELLDRSSSSVQQ
ncbi:hypothetical protein OEZ86_012927 [Tetradesmus obliquus]|nr:hypothetical protein OEZ86_012927 [Tetradesmus obliquus]